MKQSTHIRAFMYRVYDDMSVKEVAERMGVSQSTIVKWTRLASGYLGYPDMDEVRRRFELMKLEKLRKKEKKRALSG